MLSGPLSQVIKLIAVSSKIGKIRPSIAWLLVNCITEHPSWEIHSTKTTDGVSKVSIALENSSKPFNKQQHTR